MYYPTARDSLFFDECSLFLTGYKETELIPIDDGDAKTMGGEINSLAQSALNPEAQVDYSLNEELTLRFYTHLNRLQSISDSHHYSLTLRKAEKILHKLEKKVLSNQELNKMEQAYQTSFQNLPSGPSLLLQQDIEYLQRCQITPFNIVCQNDAGDKFKKPSISIQNLISHYSLLSYQSIMFSRESKNFEGIQEICDVIMLGVKGPSFYIQLFQRLILSRMVPMTPEENNLEGIDQEYESEIKKLNTYFIEDGMAQSLGYDSFQIKLIKNLEDKEKSKRLIDQGFQICTILTYPRFETLKSE
jgi:hypothetical protein